ncbi:MAG: hypothetical protein ACI4A8_10150, partial [Muribaculaceae bacterium]
MKNIPILLAEKLLNISAIKLQPEIPFVWASGWNSPIYTDNRKTLSYPDVRSFIKLELARTIARWDASCCHQNLVIFAFAQVSALSVCLSFAGAPHRTGRQGDTVPKRSTHSRPQFRRGAL